MTRVSLAIFSNSLLAQSALILSKQDRFKLVAMALVHIGIGFLDLVGVAAFGALGALSISGIQSKQPGNRVGDLLQIVGIENFSFQSQAAILGSFAVFILVGRTLLSIYFSRKTLFFLGRRGAKISAELVSKSLTRSYTDIHARSSQQTLYATTSGVENITLGVLGTSVTIISDVAALFFLSIGLFVIDPAIAVTSILMFASIGFLLYRLLHVKAGNLGRKNVDLVVQSNTQILEVVNSYREALVHNRLEFYSRKIGEIRKDLADTLAELNFMPNITKYVLEATVLLGALFIGATQFILQDASRATATLSIFLAAGTRIAPAVLRIQQGTLLVKSNLGKSHSTLTLFEELKKLEILPNSAANLELSYPGFIPKIELNGVTFTYPGKQSPAISELNINVMPGTVLAIVGPSGAGKSTIMDLMIGVLQPDRGAVLISDRGPTQCFSQWSGSISYVPQDVYIVDGTIRQNVALGFPLELATDELVWSALQIAQLHEIISDLDGGLDSQVGENGMKLSGGQKQRLGIARALFTKPKLLFLDEATSSLDGETEASISKSISALKGDVTVVLIAHRLSTVREADKVIYVEAGEMIAEGTFEEIRSAVSNFDRQAKLMGL